MVELEVLLDRQKTDGGVCLGGDKGEGAIVCVCVCLEVHIC